MNTPSVHPTLEAVTQRIIQRSAPSRQAYLAKLRTRATSRPVRHQLDCANFAHAVAAEPPEDKIILREIRSPNVGIVTAYNDMLSAHQPFERFPAIIKAAAHQAGGVAQVAGGVPAMCDGVTQGEPGMELSLFSRDVIALSTAIALSHNVFDAALCLGVCDKIVPGLLIGALQFGHLPCVFVPAGPMTSGLSNSEKSRIRQQFAEGKVDRSALLAAEMQAYHGPGTCTFYGTANSNQMLMEMMGLHLPGAAFVPPNTPLRDALTAAATQQALTMTRGGEASALGVIVDERAITNAIVGLLATGGSTNHTIHLVAIARAAGIHIDWNDFSDLSQIVPLLTHIYPNGTADVNHFHAAGGMGFLIRELIDAGLVHENVRTIMGTGLRRHTEVPTLRDGQLTWEAPPQSSADENVLRTPQAPFSEDGGLRLLSGNIGRAVTKVSAIQPKHRRVQAPAKVFHDQHEVLEAFKAGQLREDFIAVLRFQGPRANGMPELHKLTPILGALQDEGFHVALVTDGRMSGASGKVPNAIHVTPEALSGGIIAKIQDGDLITLDCETGTLELLVPEAVLETRTAPKPDLSANETGLGRELFGLFRNHAPSAEEGASGILGALP